MLPAMKSVDIANPDGKTPLNLRITFWIQKEQICRCSEQTLHWNPEKVILAYSSQ